MNAAIRPKDRRYTVADYLNGPNDERWELIDGVVYDMAPAPTIKHQRIAGRLYSRLEQKLRGKTCQPFIAPVDVVLSERDVVQPDVIVVCDPAKVTDQNIQGAPDVVVEVLSPNTSAKDLREKKALYERAGVTEYLVIDPLEEYALAFRRDEAGRFGAGDVYAARETLPIVCLEQLEIDLCEVFDLAPEAPVTSPSQADTE